MTKMYTAVCFEQEAPCFIVMNFAYFSGYRHERSESSRIICIQK